MEFYFDLLFKHNRLSFSLRLLICPKPSLFRLILKLSEVLSSLISLLCLILLYFSAVILHQLFDLSFSRSSILLLMMVFLVICCSVINFLFYFIDQNLIKFLTLRSISPVPTRFYFSSSAAPSSLRTELKLLEVVLWKRGVYPYLQLTPSAIEVPAAAIFLLHYLTPCSLQRKLLNQSKYYSPTQYSLSSLICVPPYLPAQFIILIVFRTCVSLFDLERAQTSPHLFNNLGLASFLLYFSIFSGPCRKLRQEGAVSPWL